MNESVAPRVVPDHYNTAPRAGPATLRPCVVIAPLVFSTAQRSPSVAEIMITKVGPDRAERDDSTVGPRSKSLLALRLSIALNISVTRRLVFPGYS
ncbi:hypothetical protein J6590_049992 [Homalodisca vitripennis]|nr:hypothetical protein J6590_049992 [Homalodisca vitripennis]